MRKFLLVAIVGLGFGYNLRAEQAINIGSRLELFVDDNLIERMKGAELRLHSPTPREVVLVADKPWEGNASGDGCVFQDGTLYRMYYRGWQFDIKGTYIERPHEKMICYAESRDGIHWIKPELGLVNFNASEKNNIVLDGRDILTGCLAVFKDPNPQCRPEEKYKAITLMQKGRRGLYTWKSVDGLRWSRLSDDAVITEGYFDSLNVAFWDSLREEYREYHREIRGAGDVVDRKNGLRDVMTCTSSDFSHWSKPKWLQYPGAPQEEIYNNNVMPYYRAPQIFVGISYRYKERPLAEQIASLPPVDLRRTLIQVEPRFGTALTDAIFICSRDGVTFHRWDEAFVRPGPQEAGHWMYGDNLPLWGLVETPYEFAGAPHELSMYFGEGYWRGGVHLLRMTLRMDGFVSVHAPFDGGELLTKPLIADGKRLIINYSTSAAGNLRVELLDLDGKPIPGLSLADCPEIFGDSVDHVVKWKGGSDLNNSAKRPIRLRFVLSDCDLYSFQFR